MKLRFTTRDLLWLTLVIGMALAWWIDHTIRFRETVKIAEQFRQELEARERDIGVLTKTLQDRHENSLPSR
jgi:hypothetical protein